MIVELAIATGTAPRDWWDEPTEVVVTAIDVLNQRNRDQQRSSKRAELNRSHAGRGQG
jgi:hypothetical protein